MSFKSGVQHESLAVSDKDTAMAILAGFKESKGWEGLFDVSGGKAYKAPVDGHNWELVENGMKHVDKNKSVTWVTRLEEELGGKKFTRYLERCTGCTACDEMGFRKVKTV